jgi:non-homologous end joining protein Ku
MRYNFKIVCNKCGNEIGLDNNVTGMEYFRDGDMIVELDFEVINIICKCGNKRG